MVVAYDPIQAFAAVARPILIKRLGPGAQTGCVRVLELVMNMFDVAVEPLPVELYLNGKKQDSTYLVALVNGGTFVDPTFDELQAIDQEPQFKLDPMIVTVDVSSNVDRMRKGGLQIYAQVPGSTTGERQPISVTYRRVEDQSFMRSQAWRDPFVQGVAFEIYEVMEEHAQRHAAQPAPKKK